MTLDNEALPGFPSFVRLNPEFSREALNPLEQFKFWEPERSGYPERDYATGREHFETASAFARSIQSNSFLANVVGGMCGRRPGPMEDGFIDALSCKATYGRIPDPISPTMIEHTVHLCGQTADELRFGEGEAREYLHVARVNRCPDVIAGLLITAINQEMPRGALSFLWTVCGAAYLGATN
jgi:hypothetical protein